MAHDFKLLRIGQIRAAQPRRIAPDQRQALECGGREDVLDRIYFFIQKIVPGFAKAFDARLDSFEINLNQV
jgi:hypothetical protein